MTTAQFVDLMQNGLLLVLLLALLWLNRRLKAMETFWKVVGHVTDAELLALADFRKAVKRLEPRAAEDARLEARLKHRTQDKLTTGVPPAQKEGRSSDSL